MADAERKVKTTMNADTIEYNGYVATVRYSAPDGCLVGEVINTRDSIGSKCRRRARDASQRGRHD